MKKKHLTYGKKALSVFMATLMLMTCWVFMPGEHNHASAVEQTTFADVNSSLISGLTLDASNPTTIYGSFPYDDSYTDSSYKSQIYKNVLYSGAVTAGSDGADAYKWSIALKDSDAGGIAYYYPETTFLYDGETTPTTGIMLNVDSYGNKRIRSYSGYLTDTSNLSFRNAYWYGKDTRENFQWCYFANSTTYCSTSNGTVNGSYAYTHSSGGDSYFYANILGFTGSMSDTEFYKTIYPNFAWKGNQASQGTGEVYTVEGFTVNTPIYVINYKTLKAAINEAIAVKNQITANPGLYSVKSVQQFVTYANALMAAKPGNYVTATKNDYSGYASAASAAVTNWNNWYDNGGFAQRKFDLQPENLFSFCDWAYSASSAASGASTFSYDVDAGSFTIATGSTTSEVVTSHSGSSTRNNTYYAIPVNGNTEYSIEWTASSSQNADKISSQVFAFFYDASGNAFDTWANFNQTGSSSGENIYTFTTPTAASYMEIRFDNNNDKYASNLTVKNIKVYSTARAAEVEYTDWVSGRDFRNVYSYNSSVGTLETPVRRGYIFDGWQVDLDQDGVGDYDVTSSDAVTLSYPLYSKWTKRSFDIGYENIFSLADWAVSSSNATNANATALSVDTAKGTIAVTGSSDAYTIYSSADCYRMPVTAGEEYIFTYDATSTNGTYQAFVFFYDDSNAGVTGAIYNGTAQTVSHIGVYNGSSLTFTVPDGCTKIGIRVGVCGSAEGTATYSNIGVYKTSDYALVQELNYPVRTAFYYGDVTNLTVPTRDGYAFNGWYTDEGTKIVSVEGLYESDTVYAEWIKTYKVTFVDGDGNTIKTLTVNEGSSVAEADLPTAANVTKSPDNSGSYTWDGTWDGSYENVTADVTLSPVFTLNPHTNITYIKEATAATCTAPAYWYQVCNDCQYDFGGVAQAHPSYPALGHEFDIADGATVVSGSSSGTEDTDTHDIKCARCAAVKAAAETHTFNTMSTSGANCITIGTVHQRCACGAERDIDGATDPNTHANTRVVGAADATCTADGYTGDTYCDDCQTTVQLGTAITKLGHSFTNYSSNNDATCEANGTETATCDRCTETDTREDEDSALGHDWIETEDAAYLKSAADCENDAVYYYDCSRCDESSLGNGDTTWTDEGSKWNHDYSGGYVSNNDGTHVQICVNKDCTSTGNSQNCSYGDWTTDSETTHSHTCTLCDYTPDAENHSWTAWAEVDTNTDAAEGQMTRECTVCHRVETTDCSYTSVYTAATCVDDGFTTYTCADCGHGYSVKSTTDLALGHVFEGAYSYDADNDKHQQACTRDGCTAKSDWADCSFTYEKIAGEDNHTASCVCGNTEKQACTGGTATCVTLAVCEKCNEEYGSEGAHSYTCTDEYKYLAQAATCITNEVWYKYCAGCGATDKSATYEKPDSMIAHDYTCKDEYLYKATDATCVDNETYYAYCSNADCKKSSEDADNTYEKDGTALGHTWDYSVANQSANAGYHYYDCTVCDEVKEEACVSSMPGVVSQTCTEQGYTLYTCDECSYQWIPDESYTDALGHEYTKQSLTDEYFRSAADCDDPQTHWYACVRCAESAENAEDVDTNPQYYESKKALGHTWAKVDDAKYLYSAATCTAAAKYYQSCTVCLESSSNTAEEVIYSSGARLGHDYKDNVVEANKVSDATCTQPAVYYKSCSRVNGDVTCGDVSTETFEYGEMLGHDMTKTEATPAGCLTNGNIEYWTCGNCGKLFLDEEGTTETTAAKVVTSATGHSYEAVERLLPTCETDGHSAYEKCANCGNEKGKVTVGYEATGHKFTGAYTCDETNDYHSRLCLNGCGVSGWVIDGEQIKYIVAEDGTVTGGVACDFAKETTTSTVDGKHYHSDVCVCGNERETEITDITVATVEVTCTTDGYTLHTCDACGDSWKTDIVTAEGHDYEGVTATQNADGKTHSIKCKTCGTPESTEVCSGGTATCKDKAVCEGCNTAYGSTTDHNYEDDNWVYQNDATCRANGTEKNTCTVCGTEKEREAAGTMIPHDMTDYIYDTEGWSGKPADFNAEIKEATCKAEGLAISYCQYEGCDYHKTKIIKADSSAHIWKTDENGEAVWEVLSGDCGTGITLQSTCTVCGTTQTKTESGEHKWEETIYIEPTCIKNGYREYKCSVCYFTKDEYYDGTTGEPADLAATGIHQYDNAIVTPATCTNEEYVTETCVVCGDKKVTVNSGTMLDHNTVEIAELAPTCDKAGHSAYEKCTDCGTEIGKVTEGYEATGHADKNSDDKCDECNGTIYDGDGACNCICHKTNWLMRIIYKILNFFWKLFRISQTCNCGNVHWVR